jgi:uroporphyrinogen decarboxylase
VNDLFLRACRRQPVERTPIWMMRQAGRYLPEYRAIRSKVDFVTLCKTPDLAAEVTIQPIDRLGVDAAILFSDILIPAEPMGLAVTFNPGPVLDPPVRRVEDVDALRVPDPEETVPFVYDTIRILRRELAERVPLIGFGAAPFTLAAYLVEGGGSKNFEHLKQLLYAEPVVAHRLLDKCAATLSSYLAAQVRAGAQAIQIFDTWAGLLDPGDYREFALRYARRVLDSLRESGVPRIYFALDAAHLLDDVRECGADVIGLDWRTSLTEAARRLGPGVALQGNLDPVTLLAPPAVIEKRARRVVAEGSAASGHVFNLGHGILPTTPVEHARALVDAVREASVREDPR